MTSHEYNREYPERSKKDPGATGWHWWVGGEKQGTLSNSHRDDVNTRWWFEICFIFTPTFGNDPI